MLKLTGSVSSPPTEALVTGTNFELTCNCETSRISNGFEIFSMLRIKLERGTPQRKRMENLACATLRILTSCHTHSVLISVVMVSVHENRKHLCSTITFQIDFMVRIYVAYSMAMVGGLVIFPKRQGSTGACVEAEASSPK